MDSEQEISYRNYDGYKMYDFVVNEDKYGINMHPDKLKKLIEFDDLYNIKYDSDSDQFYLETKFGRTLINKCVIGCTTLPSNVDPNSLTTEEYYAAIIEQKKLHVKELLTNVYSYGFERPSIAQTYGVLPLIDGKDSIIQFQSGTGKTATFLIGLLWGFDPVVTGLQYVFLTSTHEVANQVYGVLKKFLPSANSVLCVGGSKPQAGAFKADKRTSTDTLRQDIRKAQIVVGTVGKVFEVFCVKRMVQDFTRVKSICMDEFDHLLTPQKSKNSAYETRTEDQISSIMKEIPSYTQRVFFSATVIPGSDEYARVYFRDYDEDFGDPMMILLDEKNQLLKGIRHYYIPFDNQELKKNVLIDLLQRVRITQCIIFVNRIEIAQKLQGFLKSEKVEASLFHGGLDGDTRKRVFSEFNEGKYRFLIATNVLARGIDVQTVNLVINYDMPDEKESYIHRIGRSGRFGRKGCAINFVVTNKDMNEMMKVEAINENGEMNRMELLPRNITDLL